MGHAVASLHGGMPQGRRNRVLQGLRSRQLRILVATDVAARGIDVPTISHVINYGLPMKPEDYVHRIGRTGRAGRNGLAVTLAERMDAGMIRRIQQFTTQTIPVATIAGLEPKSAAAEDVRARAGAAAPARAAPGTRSRPRTAQRRRRAPRRRSATRSATARPFAPRPAGARQPVRPRRCRLPRRARGQPARARAPAAAAARAARKPQRPRAGGFSR